METWRWWEEGLTAKQARQAIRWRREFEQLPRGKQIDFSVPAAAPAELGDPGCDLVWSYDNDNWSYGKNYPRGFYGGKHD